MTDEEREYWNNVNFRMDDEGMWYCFNDYSRFDEIRDPEFHMLRNDFLEAGHRLRDYIKLKHSER